MTGSEDPAHTVTVGVHVGAEAFVIDLADLGTADLERVGGKAANLGELIRAGFDVPAGFCVTTAAYRLAVAPTTIVGGQISDGAVARTAVLDAAMPVPVAQQVTAAYERLAAGQALPVAVRSSATAEDLPGASFAGQQDTFLNVVGVDAVLDAVHRCWASLWTDRAMAYRAAQHIDGADVALAVVVQEMVDAAVAGVLFTADPVTGRRRQAVIDANPGLGEAVVSGAVDPDHVVVDTATGRLLSTRVGRKQLAVRAVTGGGTEQIPASETDQPCLSEAAARRLAQIGDRVEAHFGSPQDIEWALAADGRLWLTQSRPITTLFPIPRPYPGNPAADPPGYRQPRVFFCASIAQGLHRPLTPLGLAMFPVVASAVSELAGFVQPDRLAGPRAIRTAAGHVFFDLSPAVRSRVGRAIAPRVLDIMESRSAVAVRSLFDDQRFDIEPRGRLEEVKPLVRVAARMRMPLIAAGAVISPRSARRRLARMTIELRDRPVAPPGAPLGARLDAVLDYLAGSVPVGPKALPTALAGLGTLLLARRILGGHATTIELETVLRSLPYNVTTEMDLQLWELGQQVRTDRAAAEALLSTDAADLAVRYRAGTLPPGLQRTLTAFLDRYGHRAVAEIDLGVPRWSEDPTHLLGVLAGYLRLPTDKESPGEHFAQGAAEAEAMIETLAGRVGGLRGRVVSFGLHRARQLLGLREMPKFIIITVFGVVRRELLAIGAELAASGRLTAADDINMLDFNEIRSAVDGFDARSLVEQRRAERAAESGRRHVPRVMLSDGTDVEASVGSAAPAADGALIGTPASSGIVTARARVVLDPSSARLEPGEILVAPSTDPGWTPLFLTAGGLVMEMGGANSHGAVVAREYGIPAVVGVPGAVERIATGDLITVDGARGLVSPAVPTSATE